MYIDVYVDKFIVCLCKSFLKIDDVVYILFVDLYWKLDEVFGYVVIIVVIDNVMKGVVF